MSLEEPGYPSDIDIGILAVDIDVLGSGYDPDPVLGIIGDSVHLNGLFR
jgi:hypothetical protein